MLGRLYRWRVRLGRIVCPLGQGVIMRLGLPLARWIRAMDTRTEEQRRRIMRVLKSRDTGSEMIVGRSRRVCAIGIDSIERIFLDGAKGIAMGCDEHLTRRIRRLIVESLSNGHSNPRICGVGQRSSETRSLLIPRALEFCRETAS